MPTIQIIAFRGTGGFENPKYARLPGLIKAGHVGIKLEDDPAIYGFHPSPAAVETADDEDALLDLLLNHEAQEGTWQNDTVIFEQAYQLHKSGERTQVWVLDQDIIDDEYNEIRNAAMQWYNDEDKVSRYNLPKRDGTFEPGEYNCAVFPKVLGIKIPINDGRVAVYIQAMKRQGAREWQP